MLIANAVENCNELIILLDALTQELKMSTSQRKGLGKTVSALNVVRKKMDITRLENQLRDAIVALQTAIMINSSQIQ